jgi:RimJ/RimL family protein N-acetyltransferase
MSENPPVSAQASAAAVGIPVITTIRLRLRERSIDDAQALFGSLSDPELMTWWSRAPFTTIDELRDYFAPSSNPGWRSWAITREGDDRALGFVAAGEKRQGGVSEIGYFLVREAQGQGIAQEAVAAVVHQLFADGQRRVFADCDPDNVGSIALLERLGFQLEGRLRAEWRTHIGTRDSLIYGLLASEWCADLRALEVPTRAT